MTRGLPRLPLATLDAIVTSSCNLRCTYCYQNAKIGRRMDRDTLRHSVDLLLASSREETRLNFYGGEPLLELASIRDAVARVEAAPPGSRIRFGIVTNGLLLNGEAAAFLARYRFETRLSFDGVAPAQDLRAPGTFAVLDRRLDDLRSDQPRLFREDFGVSITLHSGNVRHLAESIDYFLEKGVRRIDIGPLVTHDAAWRPETLDILDAQFARVVRSSRDHYQRTGDVPVTALRRQAGETVHDPVGLSLCGVGSGESLTVDPDGRVYGCVMFAEAYQELPRTALGDRLRRMRLGSLSDARFPARYARYPAAARAARIFDDRHLKRSSYGRCGRCRHAAVCSVCPVSIVHEGDGSNPHRIPDPACAFNLVSLEYRERLPRPAGPREFLLGKAPLTPEMREIRAAVRMRPDLASRRLP